MQLEVFCLCKEAYVNELKQPTILRIFDVFRARREPALIDPFVAVASIRFYKADVGLHSFQFVGTDEKGAVLITHSEIVEIGSMNTESTTFFLHGAMPERLSSFGTFWFSIQTAGKQLGRIPLYVLPENTR